MRRPLRLASLAALLSLAALTGCSRSAALFSEQNARVHVEMLAGTIGSRPIGTPEAARARAYVIDQLRLFGYHVRVQETDARRAEFGITARVANVIGVLPGERPEAIGLLSHYDSSPDTPGAADDAFGVAVSLEAARVIASKPRRWTTFVLVTDGEETGLMGAVALMTDRDVTSRLKAYLNVEASGSGSPVMLFETGPLNGWLLRPWARHAPHPRGGSFTVEVYRRLPNDTDFSVLRRHDIPGLNFAIVGDSYAYHTARDTPERLSGEALRKTGENVASILNAMQQADITQRTARGATYFDVAGVTAITYSAALNWVVSASAVLLGIIAWLRVTRFVTSHEGAWRWLLGFVWAAAAVAAIVAGMIAATWILRSAREAYHPWYAKPDRFFFMLLSVGAGIAWGMTRLGRWLPARARGLRHPAVVWTYALPLWIVLALAAGWYVPAAAYLWTVPLLAAGLLLALVPPANSWVLRIVSLAILAVAATLWLRDAIELARFAVAALGREPIITPVYVHAVLVTVAGLVVTPPLVAAVASERALMRPSIVTTLCLVALAISVPLAYAAPAYTEEQPLRREVRAFQDADAPGSTWQVGANEPGLEFADRAPGQWGPASGAAPAQASIPRARLRHPFVFSGGAPPLGDAPATLTSFDLQEVIGGIEAAIAVVPREPGISISFVLPEGIVPARSSLPGIVRSGRWTAVYVAPPPEGIAFRASFSGPTPERLRQTRVAVTSARLPGGEGWQRLPAWMPQDRTVWTARATWVLPAPPAIAPVPSLR